MAGWVYGLGLGGSDVRQWFAFVLPKTFSDIKELWALHKQRKLVGL